MQVALDIENANDKILKALYAFLDSHSDLKYKIQNKTDYAKIQKDIKKSEEELNQKRKNGTLKKFDSVDDMFKDILDA